MIVRHVLSIAKKISTQTTIIMLILSLIITAYSIYTIRTIYDTPRDNAYYDEQFKKMNFTSFDQKTIEDVKNLRVRTDEPVVIPPGKVNPFLE